MPNSEVSLDSPIGEKIAWASQVYQDSSRRLLGDEKVGKLLEGLDHAIDDSHWEMAASGVVELYRLCLLSGRRLADAFHAPPAGQLWDNPGHRTFFGQSFHPKT